MLLTKLIQIEEIHGTIGAGKCWSHYQVIEPAGGGQRPSSWRRVMICPR
jgi:hypothetical protein